MDRRAGEWPVSRGPLVPQAGSLRRAQHRQPAGFMMRRLGRCGQQRDQMIEHRLGAVGGQRSGVVIQLESKCRLRIGVERHRVRRLLEQHEPALLPRRPQTMHGAVEVLVVVHHERSNQSGRKFGQADVFVPPGIALLIAQSPCDLGNRAAAYFHAYRNRGDERAQHVLGIGHMSVSPGPGRSEHDRVLVGMAGQHGRPCGLHQGVDRQIEGRGETFEPRHRFVGEATMSAPPGAGRGGRGKRRGRGHPAQQRPPVRHRSCRISGAEPLAERGGIGSRRDRRRASGNERIVSVEDIDEHVREGTTVEQQMMETPYTCLAVAELHQGDPQRHAPKHLETASAIGGEPVLQTPVGTGIDLDPLDDMIGQYFEHMSARFLEHPRAQGRMSGDHGLPGVSEQGPIEGSGLRDDNLLDIHPGTRIHQLVEDHSVLNRRQCDCFVWGHRPAKE